MAGDSDWSTNPHFKAGKPLLCKLSCPEIEYYMKNPNWTKVVFFRDPAERLLSAYLDKISKGSYITKRLFNAGEGEISFEQFVEIVADRNTDLKCPKGLHKRTDPHWRPQFMIGNIEKFMPYINFIGSFSKLSTDANRLLESMGLWNKYGANGWGKNGTSGIFCSEDVFNRTNAKLKMKEYYTDELLDKVKVAYSLDYQLLADWRAKI